MAAKKVYDADEIMKMAVGLVAPDVANADYDGDGKVTAFDVRTNDRIGSGLSIDTPVAGNTGTVNTGSGNKNIYAASNAYQNQADAVYKGIQEQIQNAGKGNADIFAVSDAYQKQADELYEKIKNTPDFKYDFNEDAVFKALQEQYMKDGRLAAENVAGQAAALSGGYANSYGTTAAGQAYMAAIDNLYDKVPELEAQAYGRYQDKRNAELQNWEILQKRAATERGNAESERAYKDDRDAYLMQLALQNYDILQNKADKERAYAESERAYEDERDAYLWELALQKAQLGDYSALKNLGADTTNAEYETALNKAIGLAQFGDYSGLRALGVDVSTAEKQNELDFALAAASYGDYSFLKALGIDTSAVDSPKMVYRSSGGSGGGDDGNDKKDPKTGESLININSYETVTDARNALRQQQGLPSTYELDELDMEIAKWQAILDNPAVSENNRARARYMLNQLKEQYYG